MEKIRKWHIHRALESAVLLAEMMPQLTEKEVHHCLTLEAGTRRRKTLVEALIRRAARFNKKAYINNLRKAHHVAYPVEDSE